SRPFSFYGDCALKKLPRVLIVDGSADSREVLSTLLERSGARTIEALRPDEAIALADVHRPDLIVLDIESDRSQSGAEPDRLRAAAERSDTPIVIIGTLSQRKGEIPAGQFVAKPYHYGPLVRKIEDLLAAA